MCYTLYNIYNIFHMLHYIFFIVFVLYFLCILTFVRSRRRKERERGNVSKLPQMHCLCGRPLGIFSFLQFLCVCLYWRFGRSQRREKRDSVWDASDPLAWQWQKNIHHSMSKNTSRRTRRRQAYGARRWP